MPATDAGPITAVAAVRRTVVLVTAPGRVVVVEVPVRAVEVVAGALVDVDVGTGAAVVVGGAALSSPEPQEVVARAASARIASLRLMAAP
jgi:hypothetical protein